MGKTIYRVVPRDGLYAVELAGDSFTEYLSSKGAAIARATELARRAPSGGVQVLDREGRLEREIELDPPGQ